jgi:uroporphyrin-III C-methyltransferase
MMLAIVRRSGAVTPERVSMDDWSALAEPRGGMPVLPAGHVWLAGAGPGDPGLLTLYALLALAGPRARLEFAGKRGGRPSAMQADISKRLIELAKEGRRVLRLKGGDPCIFGRGGEEAMALAAAGVPFRIIPGVTSGLAALAAASIPATLRQLNRAIILAAGHGGEDDSYDWGPLARTGEPIVLYMVMHNLERISQALIGAGRHPDTPAAAISAATTGAERIVVSTLARIGAEARQQALESPAIVVVGDIVKMRERLLAAAPDRKP